jgi:hypothetical protein
MVNAQPSGTEVNATATAVAASGNPPTRPSLTLVRFRVEAIDSEAARNWLVEKLDQSRRRQIIFMDRDKFLDHSARILLDLKFEQSNSASEEAGTTTRRTFHFEPPFCCVHADIANAADVRLICRSTYALQVVAETGFGSAALYRIIVLLSEFTGTQDGAARVFSGRRTNSSPR